MMLPLVLVAFVVAAVVPFLVWPLVRTPARESEDDARLDVSLAALERRDRALAALKELEFDHRTGKVSDDDYRAMLGGLRGEAADALRAVAPNGPAKPARSRQPAART